MRTLARSEERRVGREDEKRKLAAEDGIRDYKVTGVQTCALPISGDCAGVRVGPVPRQTAVFQYEAGQGRDALEAAGGSRRRGLGTREVPRHLRASLPDNGVCALSRDRKSVV